MLTGRTRDRQLHVRTFKEILGQAKLRERWLSVGALDFWGNHEMGWRCCCFLGSWAVLGKCALRFQGWRKIIWQVGKNNEKIDRQIQA